LLSIIFHKALTLKYDMAKSSANNSNHVIVIAPIVCAS
jgi:hypothetical protein